MARVFDGEAERSRIMHNQRVEQAWLTAALGRVKKMPVIEKLLSGTARKMKQSWQQMLAAAEGWAAAVAAKGGRR